MKSVPVAVVLGVVFGPLGLLYVGVGHAAAASAIAVALALLSGGALVVPIWLACAAWAGIAAGRGGVPLALQPIALRPSVGRTPVTVKLPPLAAGSEPSGKFCFQCGAYLPIAARFCSRCGSTADAPV